MHLPDWLKRTRPSKTETRDITEQSLPRHALLSLIDRMIEREFGPSPEDRSVAHFSREFLLQILDSGDKAAIKVSKLVDGIKQLQKDLFADGPLTFQNELRVKKNKMLNTLTLTLCSDKWFGTDLEALFREQGIVIPRQVSLY